MQQFQREDKKMQREIERAMLSFDVGKSKKKKEGS